MTDEAKGAGNRLAVLHRLPVLRRLPPRVVRRLLPWLFAGLFLRLLLLPIGISTDTLGIYWRAHVMAFDHEVYAEYLVNMGAHVVHAGWLVVVQPLLGAADGLWIDGWWWPDFYGLQPEFYEGFLARSDVLRAIALLKVPYLLADLAAGAVVLALATSRPGKTDEVSREGHAKGADEVDASEDDTRTVRAFAFWMLSPIMLYAAYLFARYEPFPVVLVLAALLLAERGRERQSALVLGLAMTMRTYPLVFAPVFALVLRRGLRSQASWLALAVSPLALTMGLNRVVGDGFGELASVGDFSFGRDLFALRLGPEGGPAPLLLVLGVVAIGIYLLGRDQRWFGSGPVPTGDLWKWLVITHLVVFATARLFNFHYLAWVTPAIVLLLLRTHGRGVLWLHLGQVLGLLTVFFAVKGPIVFTGVLGGLGTTARNALPNASPLSPDSNAFLADVGWSVFVAATLALLIPLVRRTLAEDPNAAAG